ncbi:MAG: undecaprenyl-diphosphate phosphatase [Pseudomonadota bacterium]
MPLLQLIVLAIIQGITEFLPISSSAHLILAPLAVEDWADQGPLIDIAAHLGSLGAVLIYFRRETAMLIQGGVDVLRWRDSADRRLFLFIACATIPLLALAAILVLSGASAHLRSPTVIGFASIIFGVILWHADRRAAALTDISKMTWRDTMTIGAAQALALVPGVSRSGVTMTAARYLGWSREEAARYSMLLAIPAIGALGFFASIKILREGAGATMAAAGIVAGLSFLTAYIAIAFLMAWTRRMSFTPFVIYRIALGVVILAFAGGVFG